LTARTGGLTALAARTGRAGLDAVRAEGREDGDAEGRRRSVWALFFPIGAGLRAEVRDFVTRRDFAIGGILATQISLEGTVTNRVVYGQDPKAYSRIPVQLGHMTTTRFGIKQFIQVVNGEPVAFREYFEGLPPG
jgi:hypothetical protein